MDKKLEALALFDLYGGLLTKKQCEAISQYFERDLSLGEVGENLGVSRQAVKDLIDSGLKALEHFDAQLNLIFIRSQLVFAQDNPVRAQEVIDNILQLL